VAGLASQFGSGAMTNSIAEIEKCNALFVIGSNTTESHPVLALRMKKAAADGAQIIVADPRKIPLVKFATLWLRHKPGTDAVLVNSMMHVILKERLENQEFIDARTDGYQDFKESLDQFTPEFGEKITGVAAADIVKAAKIYASAKDAGIYYTMGITQHTMGTNNVHSLANLALMTGNLGKESAGVNPLRGQNNVQGACDMGCLPNVLPGYQKVIDEAVRDKFANAWGCSIPDQNGLTATEMTGAMLEGSLKALYIMGENPALSDPNINHSVAAFKNLDFLIVQDIFLTETAELADVVLPASSFAEKDGTFTNTERRVQRVRRAIESPGDALDDLTIINLIAQRMDSPEKPDTDKGYPLSGPEEMFKEVNKLCPAFSGITYNRLETESLQWPCPTLNHPGTPFLFGEVFPLNSSGKALFKSVPYKKSKELPDDEYPFILTTGRVLFHYHTGTMTRRSKGLETVAPEAYIELNPADAEKLDVSDTDKVAVRSRRGQISLKTKITDRVSAGVVFIPFHYKEAAANILTSDALDPVCKIAEAKVCAVRIDKM
jgi:formate dehydrogenase alpha subunit